MSRQRWLLGAYMTAVCAVAAPVYWRVLDDWGRHYALTRSWPYVVLVAVLVAGEMLPIPVPRGDDAGDEVSISTTIALALMMLAPLGFAVIGQSLALAADEIRSHRMWSRLAFNAAQYALALLAARVVYDWVLGGSHAGRPVPPVGAEAIMGGLLAAAAFFVVNNTLVGVAISLKLRTPLRRQIISDFRYQAMTSGVLLALAPVTALAVHATVWALPLLLLPIAAVHRSARLAHAREHEALHDALTGLANRALFTARLSRVCAEGVPVPAAVILVDLDHFKEINDTLGHQAGDLLLIELATRLRSAVRDGDLVARLGGDEFAILAMNVADETGAAGLLDRLRAALHHSMLISGVRVDVSASTGIALTTGENASAEELLKRADVAMYASKRNRGSTTFYASDTDEHSVERLTLLGDLRHAVEQGDLFLAYQPKVAVPDGRVIGVEALARWNHPTLGVLGPARFIPLAESTGLIDTMTRALLDEGLRQLGAWRRNGIDLSLAVNLSPRLLTDPSLVDHVSRLLRRHAIPPRQLTLEVTESMIMMDTAAALTVLRRLRDVGVRLAIDDFGTGYSSLAYLKHLCVDELKVDRAFISRIATDRHDEIITEMAVALGHHFGLVVVAEGVEDERALAVLQRLGCDVVQGYHLGRPMPAEELTEWMVGRHVPRIARQVV